MTGSCRTVRTRTPTRSLRSGSSGPSSCLFVEPFDARTDRGDPDRSARTLLRRNNGCRPWRVRPRLKGQNPSSDRTRSVTDVYFPVTDDGLQKKEESIRSVTPTLTLTLPIPGTRPDLSSHTAQIYAPTGTCPTELPFWVRDKGRGAGPGPSVRHETISVRSRVLQPLKSRELRP